MSIKIPVYQPSLSGNEKKYVNDCLDSTWISSKGKYINKFESKFAEFINVNYATTVSNGTVALHLAMVALNLGPGDEVIVPTLTYIASVNSITYTGSKPVFVDSLQGTWQVDPKDIEKKITTKTKAIMVVHLYGHPCDMEEIMRIAKKHNLLVIEDCAEAFGSEYNGKHVGTFGNISTFSFFGNKTITTGEGGMVVTNDKVIFNRLVHLKGQGLAENRQYWHDVIGYNYRMTNICAAIGLAQIEQADKFIAKKRQIADKYKERLKGFPITFQDENSNCKHSYWMINILLENNKKRTDLSKFLQDNGVETRPMFYPIHTMPMYNEKHQTLPIAESLSVRGINLPSWPDLSTDQINFICKLIRTFFEK